MPAIATPVQTERALLDGPRRIYGNCYQEVWRQGSLVDARLRHLKRILGATVSGSRGTQLVRTSALPGADRVEVKVLVIAYVDTTGTAPAPRMVE